MNLYLQRLLSQLFNLQLLFYWILYIYGLHPQSLYKNMCHIGLLQIITF